MRRVVDGDARAKIQNLQLWGPLVHLGETRRNSNHLATTTEPVEPERVAGFSAFHSTSYFFVRNGLRNQSTLLDSSRTRRCIHPLAGGVAGEKPPGLKTRATGPCRRGTACRAAHASTQISLPESKGNNWFER